MKLYEIIDPGCQWTGGYTSYGVYRKKVNAKKKLQNMKRNEPEWKTSDFVIIEYRTKD